MELELGLKITKTRDDIASISEYQLAKDREGPVFKSRETNTMFILTAHLKGYKKNNIDIKISEDGSKITIKGKKPVQEMLMMGWVMHRTEVGVTGFDKVFKIPDGVNLDRIKAKYDEEEWFLNIVMPKLVKGICWARIEEVKEEESDRGRSELEKSEADHILRNVGETSQKGSKESDGEEMEGSESFMEKKEEGMSNKMFDDANREINKEKMQKEVEEYKLGIEDGNQESVRQKVGKEGYEVVKTSELEQNVDECISQKAADTGQDREFEVPKMKDSKNVEKKEGGVPEQMLDDGNREVNKERMQKEVEESRVAIEDGIGESVREKVGKEGYEVMKTSELEQNFDESISQKIAATKQARELEVPKMKDNGSAESVREKAGKEGYAVMKTSELEKNVDRSQDRESKVQKMGDSKNVEKNERVLSDKMLDNANREKNKERMQKEVQESKLGIDDGSGESVREKVKKKGYEDSKNVDNRQGGVSDKKFDDASGDINNERMKKEVEEYKLGIEDGSSESVREKIGKEGYEVMKTSELEQNVDESILQKIADARDKEFEVLKLKDSKNVVKKEGEVPDKMLDYASGDITGDTIKKEIEESKLRIEDGKVKGMREKVGKTAYEAMETSEMKQDVGAGIPQNIGDTSQDKGSKFQNVEDDGSLVEKEKMVSDKMLDDTNGNKIREMIQKEIEASKLGIEDGDGESVKEKVGKEVCEAVKSSELEQNVGARITQIIGDTSRGVSEEPCDSRKRAS
ncbi:HSP20-like chaperone [Sesbania bispinosa]|nr:HSP20-like chaperone [Sesbania bispinosa]